ncbi:MAG: DUF3263 domain-containing protein [Acidimicrobiales bacterium]
MALTERQRLVLDLEREWWLHAPTKQAAIRQRLACSPTAYYAALRRLVSSPDALSYDPLVIKRLRRRRDEGRRADFCPRPVLRHRPH